MAITVRRGELHVTPVNVDSAGVFAVGDLMWLDTTGPDFKKASQKADVGDAAANRVDFKTDFAGISVDRKLVGETTKTSLTIARAGDAEGTVASTTFEIGDLIGVFNDATINSDQTVAKVTVVGEAFGYALRQGTSVTKILFRFVSTKLNPFAIV